MAKRSEAWGVKIINHWREVQTRIEGKEGREVLVGVAAKIAQTFSEFVEHEDIVDTGFYRDSVYINGQGATSYPYTRKSGVYYGYNHSKTMQERTRSNRVTPSRRKSGIVVGVAANYSHLLELIRGGQLMGALNSTKEHYGGSVRMRIEKKELPNV